MPESREPRSGPDSQRTTTKWPEPRVDVVRVPKSELKEAWEQFLSAVPWEFFLTLTFDPNRQFDVNERRAHKLGQEWCRQVERVGRPRAGWVLITERGRGGQWHCHVLLVGVENEKRLHPVLAMWEQMYGSADVRPVTDNTGIAGYVTKDLRDGDDQQAGNVYLSDTLKRYRGPGEPDAEVTASQQLTGGRVSERPQQHKREVRGRGPAGGTDNLPERPAGREGGQPGGEGSSEPVRARHTRTSIPERPDVRGRIEPTEPTSLIEISRADLDTGTADASEDAGRMPADIHARLVRALADALVLDYEDDADARREAAGGEDHDTRQGTA